MLLKRHNYTTVIVALEINFLRPRLFIVTGTSFFVCLTGEDYLQSTNFSSSIIMSLEIEANATGQVSNKMRTVRAHVHAFSRNLSHVLDTCTCFLP